MESYGTPQGARSRWPARAFPREPAAGSFAEHPLLTPRGAMMIARGQGSKRSSKPLAGAAGHARRAAAGSTADEARAMVSALAAEPGDPARSTSPTRPTWTCMRSTRATCAACGARAGNWCAMRERNSRHRARWATILARAGRRGAATSAPCVCSTRRGRLGRYGRIRLAGVPPLASSRAALAFIFAPPEGIESAAVARWPMVFGAEEDLVHQARRRHAAAARRPMPTRSIRRTCSPKSSTRRARDPPHREGHHAHDPPHAHLGRPALLRGRRQTSSAASSPDARLLLGSRRKAATASRPRPRWAKPVRRWRAACRCPSASRASGSRPRCWGARCRDCAQPLIFPPPHPSKSHPMRVFSASLATETNTFAPMPTGLALVQGPRLLPRRRASRRR